MGAWRCIVSIVVSFVNSHVFCISHRRNWPRSAHPVGLLLHLKMSCCSLFLKLKKGKSEFLRLSAARSETLSAQPDVLEFYGAHAGPAEVPAQPLSEVALAGAPTVRKQRATFPLRDKNQKRCVFNGPALDPGPSCRAPSGPSPPCMGSLVSAPVGGGALL